MNDCPATLDHPQDKGLFARQRAAPGVPLQPSASARTSLLPDNLRMAFMSGDHVHLVAFDFPAEYHRLFFAITPSRNCVAMT